MSVARYGRWSGTQDPWGNDLSPDEVLAEIADELMDGVDPDEAIEDLLRRGIEGPPGGPSDVLGRASSRSVITHNAPSGSCAPSDIGSTWSRTRRPSWSVAWSRTVSPSSACWTAAMARGESW